MLLVFSRERKPTLPHYLKHREDLPSLSKDKDQTELIKHHGEKKPPKAILTHKRRMKYKGTFLTMRAKRF